MKLPALIKTSGGEKRRIDACGCSAVCGTGCVRWAGMCEAGAKNQLRCADKWQAPFATGKLQSRPSCNYQSPRSSSSSGQSSLPQCMPPNHSTRAARNKLGGSTLPSGRKRKCVRASRMMNFFVGQINLLLFAIYHKKSSVLDIFNVTHISRIMFITSFTSTTTHGSIALLVWTWKI
jgi:hypothetical protein